MDTLMPNGELLREFFADEEKMKQRRDELELAGGKVQRVLHVASSANVPHQGEKEIERRLRQLQRAQEKAASN